MMRSWTSAVKKSDAPRLSPFDLGQQRSPLLPYFYLIHDNGSWLPACAIGWKFRTPEAIGRQLE